MTVEEQNPYVGTLRTRLSGSPTDNCLTSVLILIFFPH